MEFIDSTGKLIKTNSTPLLTTSQSDYIARVKLVSNNYTKAKARVDRARKAHNLTLTPESYARYTEALAESEQATKEYYS